MTRGMMHDRDSCAEITSLKIYKLSHRTQASGQSVEASANTVRAGYTATQKEWKMLHISEEQMKMQYKQLGQNKYSSTVFLKHNVKDFRTSLSEHLRPSQPEVSSCFACLSECIKVTFLFKYFESQVVKKRNVCCHR